MDHNDCKEKIFTLWDNELTGAEREEVANHLRECAECRTEYSDWKRTAGIFFEATPPSSEEFVQRVMNRIRGLESPKLFKWRWLYPAIVGAAFAAFVLMMSYPAREPQESMEALLLHNNSDNIPSAWLLTSEGPNESQILGYAVGEQ